MDEGTPPTPGRAPGQVLVVDDERFFREAIQETLSGAGLECILAGEGGEALELAEEPGIGAVVLDVRLPGMDGLEVLRRLKESRPALPVIMLSAHQDQSYVLEALRLGASDYLAKPLHEEELVLAVRRALEGFAQASTAERLRRRLAGLQQASGRLAALAARGPEAREDLHAAIAWAAADALGAEKTSLMLLDPSGAELRVAAATGRKLEASDFSPVAVGEGVAGAVLARGEALWVDDLAADPRFDREPADRYASRSFAVAPVRAGERALGVLCATDVAAGEGLGEEDLLVLRVLADQAAGLLEVPAAGGRRGPGDISLEGLTARLDEVDPGDEAELARTVCEAVVSELDARRVMEATVAAVGPLLAARSAALYLRDPEGGELVREAAWSEPEAADRERLPAPKGLTGAVLETGRPVIAEEPASDPRFDAEVDTLARGSGRALVCLPLVFRGRTLGVFRAFPVEPARVSPRTGEVLGAALSAAVRAALLSRSLVESIEEVARVRREARGRSG